HVKVMMGRPLVVHLDGARLDARAGAAHRLDDRRGVAVEDRRIVDVALGGVEHGRRHGHGIGEPRLVELEAVALAEAAIALAAKRRAGVDQREVDVEEDCRRRHGPATEIAARSGVRNVAATSFTSSSVTRSSRPGSRRSKSSPRPKYSALWRKLAMPALVSTTRGIDPTR